MNSYELLIFALVGSCGAMTGLSHGGETPTTLQPSIGQVQIIAHIYYNVASGERVVTLLSESQTNGADTGNGSRSIWATQVQNPCDDAGFGSEFFYAVDNPGPSSLSTAITVMDYGNIELDTVVDCIQINWIVAHEDTDLDSDGVGDGVVGLGGEWFVWDLHNGRAECTALPLVNFHFVDLLGNIAGAGLLSEYTVDIDLVSDLDGINMSFEIGDSDGNCQTAAFCNSSVDYEDGMGTFGPIAGADRDYDSVLDSDLDGDGLFDWAWTVRFFQPGTQDFDGDGQPDGIPAPISADTIGISFGFPEGSAVDNGDGTWTWDIDTSAADAGTGEEDRYAIYSPPINGGSYYLGGYWFGGFACEDDGTGGYTPPAMFQFQLFGPRRGGCVADLNGDGELNFFDVSLFLADFSAGGDYNGDGMTNFFDVSLFIQDYNAGCP